MRFLSGPRLLGALFAFASLQSSVASPYSYGPPLHSFPQSIDGLFARQSASTASNTCASLSSNFSQSNTFTSTSSNYTSLYEQPWVQTCWLQPACIVTPEDETQLSTALDIITAGNTTFAARSGGHSASPGFGSVGENGVLISLQEFRTLSLSADKTSLTVGTGLTWGEVYAFTGNNNITVLGGREPVVGVGGFLLGGGLGVFYNTYGLGLDNVIRYKVMLTNGTAVNATQTENADLFHGLKGGITNFGIVMEFEILTQTTTDVSFGLFIYSANNTEAVLKAYAKYLIQNQDNLTNVELEITPNATTVFLGRLGHTADTSAFESFLSIPTVATAVPYSNSTINAITITIGGQDKSPGNAYGTTFTHKVTNANFFLQSYRTYLKAAAAAPPGVALVYSPQGVTTSLVSAGQSKFGGNILGLSAVPQSWVNIFADYQDISLTSTVQSIVNNYTSTMQQKAQAQGILLPYIYPNDAGAAQNVLGSFGKENVEFIRTVARKYDPKGVMQRLQNDGYLVSKVA